MVLGAVTGVGGGVLRDVVLRTGLYAIPALVGAAIVVAGAHSGSRNVAFPIAGAAACLAVRVVGIKLDLSVPRVEE